MRTDSLAFRLPRIFLRIAVGCLSVAWLVSAPTIGQIDFSPTVGKYEKLEVTFALEGTVAENLQWPFDPSPPHGIPPGTGITAEALFTPDDWVTVYSQPAFFYQEFLKEVRSGKPWYYPTYQFSWKVRFAPNSTGTWRFKLRARDAGGLTETAERSFTVTNSSNRGFVHVSSADPRYFEYDNGDHFLGLGFQEPAANLTEDTFETLQENGIDLIRVWMTPASIFGSQWNPYYEVRNQYLGYIPRPGVLPFEDETTGKTTIKMRIDYDPDGNTGWFDAARVIGRWGTPTEVKPGTSYRIGVTYRGFDIVGPRDSAFTDFGLVVKTDLGTDAARPFDAGTGTVITNYGGNTPDSWNTIEGVWYSGTYSFLPPTYITLANVNQGIVYVDRVSLREILADGSLGPEVMHKPSMEHHLYFQQRNSFAMDQIVSLAQQHGVYLKMVVLEKGETIMRKIGFDGNFASDNDQYFYGNFREVGKVRWLQQAWWRYLQARWGYSPSVHSWELLNEGDPANERHFALADEFGKYMHCRVFDVEVAAEDGAVCNFAHPDRHMVTTSFWHSLPASTLWENRRYPNLDYVDVHAYISTGWQDKVEHETDAALYHIDYSADCRSNVDYFASQNGLATKPIVRGEAGIDFVHKQQENPDLALDRQGVWLHNYVWAGLDAGALHELYWWRKNIEGNPGPDGAPGLYEIYKSFSTFAKDIPLNNGHYVDAHAEASDSRLRVVGQEDTSNGKAHLWIQNRQHTWRNVVDGTTVTPISGSLTLHGFTPQTPFLVEWWNPYGLSSSPEPVKSETLLSKGDGSLVIPVSNLATDVAVSVDRAEAARSLRSPTRLRIKEPPTP